MADWTPLFVALPLAAAFLCLLLKGVAPRAAPWLTLVDAVAVLGLGLAAVLGRSEGVSFMGDWGAATVHGTRFIAGIAVVLDPLSALFLLVIGVVTTAVVVFGFRYLEVYTGRPLYYALFNLLVAGMCGAVVTGDLFNLFVFVEVASIASYGLVAFGTRAAEVEAAFKYVLLGALASTAILLGIGVLYAGGGLLNMADIALAVREGRIPGALVLFASAVFLAGFGLKAALMPFHAWLPDAHPSAPAPISAMLSGLLIKTLGIYAIIRVFYTVLGMDARVQSLLLVLGSISMVAAVLLALGQDDLKRLLAYSSISQMGYVLVALGINTTLGVTAAVFHAMNHALFKSALFLSSGSLERISGTRRLSGMGGLVHRAPATALGTMGASLSIAGVPPFNGFWSKLLVLVALFQAGQWTVAALAAGTAVLTLVTFVNVQRRALFGPLPERLAHVGDVPASMSAPVLALVFLCLVTFVLWPLGLDTIIGDAAGAVRAGAGATPAIEHYLGLVLGRP
jgi:multicomponent Na+:H+ antiporter subunit D